VRRLAFSTLLASVVMSGGMVVGAPAASADAAQVVVVAPTAPVAMAGRPIDVSASAVDLGRGFFCSSAATTVTWWYDGRGQSRSAAADEMVSASAVTVRIPAHAVRPGIMHYLVTVRQQCGVSLGPCGVEACAGGWTIGRWPQDGTAAIRVLPQLRSGCAIRSAIRGRMCHPLHRKWS
jgi:hypothetical protein